MNGTSDSCLNCGGLILEPGRLYGYAGKVCHCPIHPARRYQNPASNPLSERELGQYRPHPNGVEWIRDLPDGRTHIS